MMEHKLRNKNFPRRTQIRGDYHNLCRLCLTKTNLKLNMCLEEGQRRDIQGKILTCLSLIVTEDDSFPKFVCYSCIDKLENFQDFRDMCHESETLLNEYLQSAEEKCRRKSSYEKSSASWSHDSEETVTAPVSDAGFPTRKGIIKPKMIKVDSLVSEQTSVGNECPSDQPYVKTEIVLSLVPSVIDASVDSKLSSQFKQEPLVHKVESNSDDGPMYFEDTPREVPSGQNVLAEDSDNDVLILSDDEGRKNSAPNPDQVKVEVADPAERYLNKNFMERQMRNVPRLPPFPSLYAGKSSIQEQQEDNTKCISGQLNMGTHSSQKSFRNRADFDHGSDDKKKQFMCSNCNKVFTKRRDIIRHLHTIERPFSCSICNKDFPRKWSLTRHIRLHTKEEPFSCLICNKNFTRKDRLNQHTKLHTKEKPFSCLICNKKFTRKDRLNQHTKLHTEEKPFSCLICNKKFTRKDRLNQHTKLHTKDKPFSCLICNKNFTRKDRLNEHTKLHTKEKPYSCSILLQRFHPKTKS